eukprot:UN04338
MAFFPGGWSHAAALPVLFDEDTRRHLKCLQLGHTVRKAAREGLSEIYAAFSVEASRHSNHRSQPSSDLNACYRAAHECYPRAFMAVLRSARAGGIGPERVLFRFKSVRRLLAVTRGRANGQHARVRDLSQHTDILSFTVVFPT